MNCKDWRNYALHRGRVRNTKTGTVGNLVDWLPGAYCKVFTGYAERIGNYQPANFETWPKSDCALESNAVPVQRGTANAGKPFALWVKDSI